MKNILTLCIVPVLTISSLTGFAWNPAPFNTFSQNIQNIQNINKDQNRYHVAGIEDVKEFENTFSTIKELIAKDDKIKLSDYIQFPINVTIDKNKLTISTPQDFIANYNKIINDNVKSAIKDQLIEDTFVNSQGVMVGDGQIWLNVISNNKHKYGIIAINN